jgi:F-box protein 11
MNDHDLEQRLRDWTKADAEVTEPVRLRERVLAVPEQATTSSRLRLPQLPGWLRMRSISAPLTALVVMVLFAVVLLPAVLLGPSDEEKALSAGATIVVVADGSGQYRTIGKAVEAAEDGDTIVVKPGIYRESVVIAKDITLRGEGDRDEIIIEVPAELPGLVVPRVELPFAIRLDDSSATVSNLTFRGPASAIDVRGGSPRIENVTIIDVGIPARDQSVFETRPVGLSVDGESAATVMGSVLQRSDIMVLGASRPVIRNNRFVEATIQVLGLLRYGSINAAGITDEPDTEAENVLFSDALIVGNVFRDPWTAILISEGATARIEDNDIVGAKTTATVLKYAGPGTTVRRNVISDGGMAIMVVEGESISIDANEIVDNETGITITGSDATLLENMVSGNEVGVVIIPTEDGASPTLQRNTIEGNGRGLAIMAGTSPVLSDNVVCDNETNVVVVEGATVTLEGNQICAENASAQ